MRHFYPAPTSLTIVCVLPEGAATIITPALGSQNQVPFQLSHEGIVWSMSINLLCSKAYPENSANGWIRTRNLRVTSQAA